MQSILCMVPIKVLAINLIHFMWCTVQFSGVFDIYIVTSSCLEQNNKKGRRSLLRKSRIYAINFFFFLSYCSSCEATPGRNYGCKTFFHGSERKINERTHSREKLFVCTFCSMSFSFKSHIKINTLEKHDFVVLTNSNKSTPN